MNLPLVSRRSILGAMAGGVVSAVPGAAATSPPEKQDLFLSGKDGYALYRIPGMVVTRAGTVLIYLEARKNLRGDWGTIDLMLRRSVDGGRHFSPRVRIGQLDLPVKKNPVALAQGLATTDEVTYNNPVAIASRDGTVHFVFCLEYMRAFYMRSDDDGVTYSNPVEITGAFETLRPRYDWKVIATGPGHGIELQNGRLLIPIWMSLATGEHAHRPSVVSTIYSDDRGRTWKAGDIAVADTERFVYPNETCALELTQGGVLLNSRSESKAHRRILVTSPDGATRWSQPRFEEDLVEPICMGSMIRLSMAGKGSKNRILFANPRNLERSESAVVEGRPRDRRNVSIHLSYDEGESWPIYKSLEPGMSGYSDLAVLPDGTILCFYERAEPGSADLRPDRLTLARFKLEWLTEALRANMNATDLSGCSDHADAGIWSQGTGDEG